MAQYGTRFKFDMLEDSVGSLGTNGQVLTRVGTESSKQVEWTTPSGGGGDIGGSITNTQVAFGDTTANDIKGSANITFVEDATGSGISTFSVGGGEGQSIINAEQENTGTARARVQVSKNGVVRGYLECTGSSTDFNITAAARLVLASDVSQPIGLVPGTGVAIGLSSVDTDAGLHVDKRIVGNKGIQVGNEDSTTAVQSLEGTLRYNYVEGAVGAFSYSHIEMCMQTDNSTWSWVNIETNRWTQN
jgi:hypothetical protein